MKIIGILGGVASGKSFVADCFRELGAVTLDGDRTGHEILKLAEVRQAAGERWGSTIFNETGDIDRKKLANIVFAEGEDSTNELAFLESLTHQRIGQRLAEEAAALRAEGNHPIAIIDAPVLLKAGWDQLCDYVVFVDAPIDIRRQRAKLRGWADGELERREQKQTPLMTKRARADRIIDNAGSAESTQLRVKEYWRSMVD